MNTSAIIIKKVNNLYLQIISSDTVAINKIVRHFSKMSPKAPFSPKFKMGVWDGKINFINKTNMTIPFGLWEELIGVCNSNGIAYSFEGTSLSDICNKKVKIEHLKKFSDMIMSNCDKTIRDYQLEALHRTIMFDSSIVLAATGAGKSLIIYNNIRFNLFTKKANKIILIVPSQSLVEQMYTDFKEEYGWDEIDDYVIRLHSARPEKERKSVTADMDKQVLITTYQSVVDRDVEFFQQFDSIIIDEVHLAKCESIKDINKKTFGCKMRTGFTGTLPDKNDEGIIDFLTIVGYLGPVVYNITAKQLIDAGVLADIEIKNLILRYPKPFADKNRERSYDGEQKAITSFKPRNTVIKDIITDSDDGDNILVLVKSIDHLKELKADIEDSLDDSYTVSIIYGNIKAKDRERIRTEMDKAKNYILVATYKTLSTGINIKNINHVVLAAGYKSKFKVLQSIGRGLRKSETKSKVIIWDMVDDLSVIQGTGRRVKKNYSYKHYEKRLIQYTEQGFPYSETLININE
jgi:superfamily II DNA or RNA helicase